MVKTKNRIRENRIFHVINVILLTLVAVICILPILNVIALSFSSAGYTVSLLPKGFTLYSYGVVLSDMSFYMALLMSVFTTVVGMALSVSVLFAAAFPLSKPDFPFRRGFMIFFIIIMLFSGGIVPNFLVVKMLGILNTPFALVFPSVIQVFNLILIKNYLESIPRELEESATIDGAGSVRVLVSILLPLSLPMVASVCLFTAVTYWNNYYNALLYLPNAHTLYPLPMYILNTINSSAIEDVLGDTKKALYKQNIESAMIVLSIIPIVAVYPFLLKFFVKGVMVGAVKG